MANDVFHGIKSFNTHYRTDSRDAYTRSDCASCGSNVQMGVVAYRVPTSNADYRDVHWLVCASCAKPYLLIGETVFPPVPTLPTPGHLPPEIAPAWAEVASCLGVGAFTASAIMCRKILLHVAVSEGLEPEDEKGWTPNFEKAVDHLASVGVITAAMTPWVTKVRTSGNTAAHKLPATSKDEAQTLAEFTRQLLVLHYEMPGALEAMQ